MAITRQQVLEALSSVQDPDLHRDLVSLDMVKDVRVEGSDVFARVVLTTPACPLKAKIQADCEQALREIPGIGALHITMDAVTTGAGRDPNVVRLPGVKNVIAVGAGKGGVGKSTVAVNLALALCQSGATVGLLDADIYGPSVPIMLGLRGAQPTLNESKQIEPLERYGLKCISMGFLLKENDAVVWRGPMLGRALQQFIEDVAWGDLDYLIVDLPPGTGDVSLSLTQLIPLSGAIVVTTPQDVAFADVLRAVKMFGMLHVSMLGLVENMAYFHCPDNEKDYYIFGRGKIAAHCEEQRLRLLGSLPLDMDVAPAADRGEPVLIANPESDQARRYLEIAQAIAAEQSKANFEKTRKAALKDFFKVVPGAPV